MSKPSDTKLARQLQKRGGWNSYSSCLREVQKALANMSTLEVREAIDRGNLDPPKLDDDNYSGLGARMLNHKD